MLEPRADGVRDHLPFDSSRLLYELETNFNENLMFTRNDRARRACAHLCRVEWRIIFERQVSVFLITLLVDLRLSFVH